MVKTIAKIVVLLGLFLAVSCKKAEDRRCFKSIGEDAVLELFYEQNVDSLYLYDDMFYTLIPSDEERIEVLGGKNLISHIYVSSGAGKITIKNENKCNFLRSLDTKIEVRIYLKDIRYIEYHGSSELKNIDTLHSSELRLFMVDGAGEVDLTVENGYMSAVSTYGYGDFTLRGSALTAFFNCQNNTYCDTRGFSAIENLKVVSHSAANMVVNADNVVFEAEIKARGNIKYVGTPSSIDYRKNGSGKLIDGN